MGIFYGPECRTNCNRAIIQTYAEQSPGGKFTAHYVVLSRECVPIDDRWILSLGKFSTVEAAHAAVQEASVWLLNTSRDSRAWHPHGTFASNPLTDL